MPWEELWANASQIAWPLSAVALCVKKDANAVLIAVNALPIAAERCSKSKSQT